MASYSIYIIEDEPIIAEDVAMMLMDMGYTIAGVAHDYETALKGLQEIDCDLILLDINLNTKQEGLDLGGFIHRKLSTPFIYMTSYSDKETIQKAKYTEPAAYIIKPIDERDLQTNLEIALYKYSGQDSPSETHESNESDSDFLFIKDGTEWHRVHYNKILYATGEDNYTTIHTSDRKYILSKTLKSIGEQLPDSFIRIHKSHVVHRDAIDRIEDGYAVIGKTALPIGRSYKSDLFSKLNTLR